MDPCQLFPMKNLAKFGSTVPFFLIVIEVDRGVIRTAGEPEFRSLERLDGV